MLVDHLLLAVRAEHNDEVVKARHDALELEAVHEEHGHGRVLAAHLV